MGDKAGTGDHFKWSMRLASGVTAIVTVTGKEIVAECRDESGSLVPFLMNEDEADDFATLMRMASSWASLARQIEGRNH